MGWALTSVLIDFQQLTDYSSFRGTWTLSLLHFRSYATEDAEVARASRSMRSFENDFQGCLDGDVSSSFYLKRGTWARFVKLLDGRYSNEKLQEVGTNLLVFSPHA